MSHQPFPFFCGSQHSFRRQGACRWSQCLLSGHELFSARAAGSGVPICYPPARFLGRSWTRVLTSAG
jgi:hypothetical protein